MAGGQGFGENEEEFDELYSKSNEVARLISGFIRYLLSKANPRNSRNPNDSKNSTNSGNSTN